MDIGFRRSCIDAEFMLLPLFTVLFFKIYLSNTYKIVTNTARKMLKIKPRGGAMVSPYLGNLLAEMH